MTLQPHRPLRVILALAFVIATLSASAVSPPVHLSTTASRGYLVQAKSTEVAVAAVGTVGGTITRHLSIINGVATQLTPRMYAQLVRDPRLTLHADGAVQATGGGETDTAGQLLYPGVATGAYLVHQTKIKGAKTECKDQRVVVEQDQKDYALQGWGVTVAVIDSGFMRMKDQGEWKKRDDAANTLYAEHGGRCVLYRDFLARSATNENAGDDARNSTDQHGHGTHVVSTIVDNRKKKPHPHGHDTPVGVAPKVNLLVARALDKDGAGSYTDVIAAIEWIVANKTTYNVKVLNLSIHAPVTGPYWADPMNQAVMKAWQAGITVVVAAGNAGPQAGTITAPGNIPYVITVGAIKSGRYTANGDDELAKYSSRGPTESAFVKPDLLVPASRTIAPLPDGSTLAQQMPEARVESKDQLDFELGSPAKQHTYYRLSGTSMASAEVSGIAALIHQANPRLSNDQVKYRLMATARPALDQATGLTAYTPWEQGAGLVDTQAAVFSTDTTAANTGMDIALDLNTDTHYWGHTVWESTTGNFLLQTKEGEPLAVWDGSTRSWAGGTRSWAGGTRSWAGGTRSWAGGTRSWAGGTRSWAGTDSLWAGGTRSWAGTTPETSLSTASHAELLVND